MSVMSTPSTVWVTAGLIKDLVEDPDAWEKFCEGEEKVQGVFVGAVMKASKGQADGKAVSSILRQRRG